MHWVHGWAVWQSPAASDGPRPGGLALCSPSAVCSSSRCLWPRRGGASVTTCRPGSVHESDNFNPYQEKTMNIPSKKQSLVVCAYLASVVGGFGGFAVPAGAQNAVSQTVSQSYSASIPATSGTAVLTDGEL